MSVVGFDVGSKTCFIGVARSGGIETIANEYSARSTPSVVSFGEYQRSLGTSGQNKLVTNLKHTVHCFKQLVGRSFDDNLREYYSQILHYELVKVDIGNGVSRIGVNMQHMGQLRVFTIEQVLGMLLGKLKTIAEANLNGVSVNDCVITVPFYLTNSERAAWLEAADIAKLKCLRLMNETTATALSYGIFRSGDLPDQTADPRRVAFIDIGYTQTQCSLVNFHKGKLQIKGLTGNRNLGGMHLDQVIVEHFVPDFDQKYKFNADGVGLRGNKRAMLRLQTEAEKLKKLMSANATELSMNCECLMNDTDVTGRMKRETFEELCANKGYLECFKKIFVDLKQLLTEGKGDKQKTYELDSVEIVGGSSRVPFIKKLIKEVFGKAPKTSLNADESAARGGALQCAILSSHLRVREFEVKDAQPHEIRIDWMGSDAKAGNAIIFAENESVPLSKVLTFNRKTTDNFEIKASYTRDIQMTPALNEKTPSEIGRFTISGLQPQSHVEEGDSGNLKLKVKLRMDNNGMLVVPQAVQIDKQKMLVDVEPEKKPEPPAAKEPEKKDPAGTATTEEGAEEQAKESEQEVPPVAEEPMETVEPVQKEVVKTVKVELRINSDVRNTLSRAQINEFQQAEFDMCAHDRRESERQDAKNALEEFVYAQRDKIIEQYVEFITSQEKQQGSSVLESTEEWLYDEGEDQKKEVYVEKFNELKKMLAPIQERHYEFHARPGPTDALSTKIVQVRKFLEKHRVGDATVAHIDAVDVGKVANALDKTQLWFTEKLVGIKHLNENKTIDPASVVMTANITFKLDELVRDVEKIMNTPKPAPPLKVEEKTEEPPVDPEAATAENKTDVPTDSENTPKNVEPETTDTTQQMDLD